MLNKVFSVFVISLILSRCVIAPPVKNVGTNIGVLTLGLNANELCNEYKGFKGKKGYVHPVKLDIDTNYQLVTKKQLNHTVINFN